MRIRAGLDGRAPQLTFARRGAGVAAADASAPADIEIAFKSLSGAFRVFVGLESVGRAYCEHRFVLKGNINETMCLVRAIEIAEGYLFPRVWNRRILKHKVEKRCRRSRSTRWRCAGGEPMRYFEFYNPVQICAGDDALGNLKYAADSLGIRHPLLLTDETLTKLGLAAKFLSLTGLSTALPTTACRPIRASIRSTRLRSSTAIRTATASWRSAAARCSTRPRASSC